jgi:hypothetical protein
LLIVVILDGALTSTVIVTLSYTDTAGQKVNCRPLAKGRKFKLGVGPEGGRGETGQLCTGARRLRTQYVPLAAVRGTAPHTCRRADDAQTADVQGCNQVTCSSFGFTKVNLVTNTYPSFPACLPYTQDTMRESYG